MIDNKDKMLLCGLTLILLAGQSSRVVLAEQIVESPRPVSTVPMQLPDENKYDTDLSITHLDISLKTDFKSNSVDTVVKASVENFSENTVDRAEFLLCPGMNYSDLSADIKHIYFLDRNKRKDVKYAVRRVEDNGGKEWDIYVVSFERPVLPGEKLGLEFEYAIKGKPDHSSAPICKSKVGLKELFLKGDDWFYCPAVYVKSKRNVRPRTYQPSWKLCMEYPAGYVAVADGDPVRREERDGVVKEEWKSLMNGIPYVFISEYEVERRSERGVTLEIYASDEELLRKGAEKLDDYARIFNLYVELYGHPGSSVYRIVGSSALEGGGMSTVMGQVVSMHGLDDTSLIAHEMAHTWWCKLIDNYGEGTKFLSEAMAEFSSRYVRRRLGEENCLSDNWIRMEKRRYFCPDFAVSDTWTMPPLIQQEGHSPGSVTAQNYHRGPLVLNQIRLILGDKVFLKCLKAFAMKYKGKTVNIYDFIDTVNRVSGRDMTSELKGLLWSTGYASYRLAGFQSEKESRGYRTTLKIQNDGEYGLTCPLLLRMRGGERREVFIVAGKDEKELAFTTEEKVIGVVIDPELTTFQYHPEQKTRLWMAVKPEGMLNRVWYGKSYMYYSIGEYKKAIDTITEFFSIRQKKAESTEKAGKMFKPSAAYLFMRGVYYLALDDREHAEKDIKGAFPNMLDALQQGESVGPLSAFYTTGAIPKKDLGSYLALLKQISGKEFSFETGLDEEAKKRKAEEWKQWWEKEGKYQKLDLRALKERFADSSQKGTRERARDVVVHIEKGLVLDIPDVRPLCDEMDVVKRRVNVGNCELYCEIEGDGTPLVLINGGPGGTHHGFHPSFSRAKGFAKVIYYDQRGCGLSDYEQGEGYSVEQAVEDLENLRKALGIEKWVVLGHSYGGVLAQAYCVTYPHNMAGLILPASSEAMPVKLKPTRQYLLITERERAKMRTVREEIRRLQRAGKNVSEKHVLFNNWLNGDWKRQNYYKPSTEEIARIARYGWKHDKVFRQALGSDSRGVDLKGAFQDCPIPTLLLEGKWDLTWDTDKAGILGRNHPNGRLTIFQESAHSPFNDEPEAFFNTLRDFIINLPNVPSQKLERWKSYLAKWREEKKDPLLAREMSPEEAQAIEEFRRVKAGILGGERYEDTSTPLHAVLTFLSAKHYNTDNYLMKLDILRAPLPAAQPEKGTLWPVYMRYPKRRKLADTFILAYSKGKWLWLGNQGCAIDWRASRPTFEEWLERRSGKEEFQSKR